MIGTDAHLNVTERVTTTDPPACDCVTTRDVAMSALEGRARPTCTEHEAAAITAADAAARRDREIAEAARMSALYGGALADAHAATAGPPAAAPDWTDAFRSAIEGTAPSSSSGAPVALNDDRSLAAIVAGALGGPVSTDHA